MSVHTWTSMVFSPVTIMGSVVNIFASYSSCSSPMTSWPEWIARSRWMWQCWISVRHSTLSPTCTFSGSLSSLVYMGSFSPGYAPFWQPGHNGWWSRAVTSKHIPWPSWFHRGPYWGPYFSCDFLMIYQALLIHKLQYVCSRTTVCCIDQSGPCPTKSSSNRT